MTISSNENRINLVIICQKGRLEIESAFLHWTLIKNIPNQKVTYNICIPDIDSLIPLGATINYFKTNQTSVHYFKNSFLESKKNFTNSDFISNKIYALQQLSDKNALVFLDSDMCCIQPFKADELYDSTSASLKIANRYKPIDWIHLFETYHIPQPKIFHKTAIDNMHIPPYFNAGVIGLGNQIKHQLLQKWQEYYLHLAKSGSVQGDKTFTMYRDQIALTMALGAIDWPYKLLNEKFNFPFRAKSMRRNNLPALVHYHQPISLCSSRLLFNTFREFQNNYPFISDLVQQQSDWESLFNASRLGRYLKVARSKLGLAKYNIKNRFYRLAK
jgi:hypothetical protein